MFDLVNDINRMTIILRIPRYISFTDNFVDLFKEYGGIDLFHCVLGT